MKLSAGVVCLMAFALVAGAAQAEPFAGTDLFKGRSVKPSTGAQTFAIGLTMQFAPMNMLLSSQKDTIIDTGIESACKGDAACESVAHENADAALDVVGELNDDDWAKIEAAAMDSAALQAELQAAGVPAEGVEAVATYVDKIPTDKRKDALALSRQLAAQEATSIAVEPNLDLNFELVSFSLRFPMAVFDTPDETSWNLGNINLDTRFGHLFGTDLASFGVSYGLAAYLPTGSADGNSMGLADLFFAPKYFHEYLSLAPYVAMGFDVPAISLQWHGELVSQFGVRGDPEQGHVMYGKYGAGLVLFAGTPLSIIGEVNGLAPIKDADPYNAIFGLGGVQLNLFWLKIAAAIQAPLSQPEKKDMGTIGGMDAGELSSYSIITRAALIF